MTEHIWVKKSDFFEHVWWKFYRFKSETYDETCLFIMDSIPPKFFGYYFIN